VAGMRRKLGLIAGSPHPPMALSALVGLQEEAAERVAKAPALTPLEASDREDALTDWLDERGITNGWELAPVFVQAGLDTAWLDQVAATVAEAPDSGTGRGPAGGALDGALRWLGYTVETELLMNEIADSVTRISALVDAAKQYSQLDRAPYQVVDVHDLLDSTLAMLGGKIGDGVTVVKDYTAGLPRIPAYPSELNQVWTNLIDNAVAAMDGHGTLTVRTAMEGGRLLVEFADTGPGIPPDIQERIFEPFFTTKPVGQGTGLGLDISWRIVVNRHHGDLRAESVPGDTRLQVRLPLSQPQDG
jgi:signal transduction histidine kinase